MLCYFLLYGKVNPLYVHIYPLFCRFPSHLEKVMATHSSVLAWRVPGTGEPGGLRPWGRGVGHDWSDLAEVAERWVKFPVLCSRFSLVIYFMHSSIYMGFPDGSDGEESVCNGGDPGLIPESGRSPGEQNHNQYCCLKNSMDRIVCGLQPVGSQRVGYNRVTNTHTEYIYIYVCQSQSPNSSHPPFLPLIFTCLFSTMCFFLLCKWAHLYHFSRSHIYALIYNICFSDLLHSVWQSLSPSMSLQTAQFHSFLWLSNIQLYMCHIFFIHSFAEWWTFLVVSMEDPQVLSLRFIAYPLLQW